ncbi:MAG: hypothetical protein WCX28_00190 [Bacteriovoracaceae bacterium]|nr:hypothetical protein [Bacteroidota bacterium]
MDLWKRTLMAVIGNIPQYTCNRFLRLSNDSCRKSFVYTFNVTLPFGNSKKHCYHLFFLSGQRSLIDNTQEKVMKNL